MNASLRSVATLVVLILLSPAVNSQEPPTALPPGLPLVPGKIVRSLTPAPGYFTEPGIAVNPRDPQQIVAVFQDNAHASYSVNGGRGSFANYAWTDNPFEAGGVFFGDYTGIAAFGGRVYGVWTEKPPNQLEPGPSPDGSPRRKQGTVVKVGVADFSNAENPSVRSRRKRAVPQRRDVSRVGE